MPDASTLSANQLLWLDANRDGAYVNGGDVLYAARALAGSTAYPVFEGFDCPTTTCGDLSLKVACYSSEQALLSNV